MRKKTRKQRWSIVFLLLGAVVTVSVFRGVADTSPESYDAALAGGGLLAGVLFALALPNLDTWPARLIAMGFAMLGLGLLILGLIRRPEFAQPRLAAFLTFGSTFLAGVGGAAAATLVGADDKAEQHRGQDKPD